MTANLSKKGRFSAAVEDAPIESGTLSGDLLLTKEEIAVLTKLKARMQEKLCYLQGKLDGVEASIKLIELADDDVSPSAKGRFINPADKRHGR